MFLLSAALLELNFSIQPLIRVRSLVFPVRDTKGASGHKIQIHTNKLVTFYNEVLFVNMK